MGTAYTREGFKLEPYQDDEPVFDPHFGFEKKRKERVMIATKQEMMSARLDFEDRDYCAHKAIDYLVCRRDNYPWIYKCGHAKHDYLNCRYEDHLLRMKEFEREKRLRHRQKRILDKQAVSE